MRGLQLHRRLLATAATLTVFAAACSASSPARVAQPTSSVTPPGTVTPALATPSAAATRPSPTAAPTGYKDATYEVSGKAVQLVNGVSETEAAPGSASKVVTKYFGNESVGDLDGDGQPDVGFLLTQNAGGSGTFYYAVAALQTPGGWNGTNAVLLGDRVAPQTTRIDDGTLIINYADRNPDEPMITRPSLGVSKYLKVVSGKLVEPRP